MCTPTWRPMLPAPRIKTFFFHHPTAVSSRFVWRRAIGTIAIVPSHAPAITSRDMLSAARPANDSPMANIVASVHADSTRRVSSQNKERRV